MITSEQSAQLDQALSGMKATNPTLNQGSTGGANDWYSQIKSGGYRPAVTAPVAQEPSFGERVQQDYQKRGTDVMDAMSDFGKKNDFSVGARMGGAIVGLPADVADEAIKSIPGAETVGNTLKSAFNAIKSPAWDKLGALLSPHIEKLSQEHPEAADVLKALGEATRFAGTAVGGRQIAEDLPGMLKSGGKAIKDVLPKSVIPKTAEEKAVLEATNLKDSALKRVTPDYASMSDTKRAAMQNQTVLKDGQLVPRVTEGKSTVGLKGERIVNRTMSEEASGEELSKVKGYDSKMTNLETHNLIKKEIGTEATSLIKKASKIAVRLNESIPTTVKKAINNVSQESLLLENSDPAIYKYMRVLNNASLKADGTVNGILDVRKAMDAAYENARGRMAFGSDKLSALDEIHTAGRDALNELAINSAKDAGDDFVTESLKKQTNLYRADDVINARAAAEAGTSVGRGVQKMESTAVGRAVLKTGKAAAKGAAMIGGIKL